ncbi:MAG: hypothetical protein LUH07_14080 [Lachnospiraceae bacterium]|nr:hypothetical protein [Lachnospiraceae bacterium]
MKEESMFDFLALECDVPEPLLIRFRCPAGFLWGVFMRRAGQGVLRLMPHPARADEQEPTSCLPLDYTAGQGILAALLPAGRVGADKPSPARLYTGVRGI